MDVVDAFGSNINDIKHTSTLIGNGNLKNNTKTTKHEFNDDFDQAFGALQIDTTKNANTFDFDDGFADFGKFESLSSTKTSKKPITTPPALKKPSKNLNGVEKTMTNNKNYSSVKVADRYAGDYSRGEKFDDDLQAVLQRSLVDQ